MLTVRSFCNTQYDWDVFFAQNKVIAQTFAEKGYPVPEQHWNVRGMAAA